MEQTSADSKRFTRHAAFACKETRLAATVEHVANGGVHLLCEAAAVPLFVQAGPFGRPRLRRTEGARAASFLKKVRPPFSNLWPWLFCSAFTNLPAQVYSYFPLSTRLLTGD
jgi:hypothetical protein